SAKIMRMNYEGNTFPPMGCLDGQEIITYKINSKLYVESFERMWDRLKEVFEIKEQIAKGNYYMDLKNITIYDTQKGFVNCQKIIKNKDKGDWCQVKFSNGRSLLTTSDHPLPIKNKGRIFVKDLKIGDLITINQNQYSEEIIDYNIDKAWLLGFILCDGCYSNGKLISSIALESENDIEENYKRVMKQIYNMEVKTIERHRGKKGYYKDLSTQGKDSCIRKELSKLFEGKQKNIRHIPNEVFSWNRKAKLSFLAGMLDADGYINSHSHGSIVQLGSTNKELALQTMALAQSLDYQTKVYLNHYDSSNKNKIRYRIEFTATIELLQYSHCEKKINHFNKECNIGKTNEACVTSVEFIGNINKYSYDVTTDSDHFEVSGVYSHNCRSHLSPWKDKDGNYKWYGRFNQGVVSLNLPQIGILAKKDMNKFWKLFDDRLEICKEALIFRHNSLKGTLSDVSPIHWQHGAIARLKKGEKIDKLLENGYSSLSLGYVGIYECVQAMLGVSNTTKKGEKFALEIMNHMKEACDKWKTETGLGFSLYGTPAENTVYTFCRLDKQRFGEIPNVTDKLYYTNSYHVNVCEKIDAFSKLKYESQFHNISLGGCISYIEVPDMTKNIEAVEQIINFIYHNIQYAEINTKPDVCYKCGYKGEILNDENFHWYCPNCGNRDENEMQVMRRTCGYIGTNFWSKGRTQEIKERVCHL
ncbi:MAG: anaerobic ribonucleoside-triphosphate reductase, partial [Clostridium sp.]